MAMEYLVENHWPEKLEFKRLHDMNKLVPQACFWFRNRFLHIVGLAGVWHCCPRYPMGMSGHALAVSRRTCQQGLSRTWFADLVEWLSGQVLVGY
ncbi:hypothetical protein SUGI_1029240 [Cryptomeria japonica]|nr:hypothetical protein SUGI_1029240 [Cryptomeria japonica]